MTFNASSNSIALRLNIADNALPISQCTEEGATSVAPRDENNAYITHSMGQKVNQMIIDKGITYSLLFFKLNNQARQAIQQSPGEYTA